MYKLCNIFRCVKLCSAGSSWDISWHKTGCFRCCCFHFKVWLLSIQFCTDKVVSCLQQFLLALSLNETMTILEPSVCMEDSWRNLGIYHITCTKNCLCSCGMTLWFLACPGPRQRQEADGGGGQRGPAARWRSCHPRCCFHHRAECQGQERGWAWLESLEHPTQVCFETFLGSSLLAHGATQVTTLCVYRLLCIHTSSLLG